METSLLPVRLYQRLGLQWAVRRLGINRFLPGVLAKMEGILPTLERPLRLEIPEMIPAQGKKRGRVAFFLGCAMSLVFPEVSRQTARILSQQGFEVVTPREVKCCGAPHLAEGDRETARRLALMNLDLFLGLDVDYIVTDCAGCGCALKEYEEILEGHADHERLRRFRAKIRDISEFLAEVGIRTEDLRPVPMSVTYHEPCHLVHGQGLSGPPRQVIRADPRGRTAGDEGIELVLRDGRLLRPEGARGEPQDFSNGSSPMSGRPGPTPSSRPTPAATSSSPGASANWG